LNNDGGCPHGDSGAASRIGCGMAHESRAAAHFSAARFMTVLSVD
jgi:hypothetical protein